MSRQVNAYLPNRYKIPAIIAGVVLGMVMADLLL